MLKNKNVLITGASGGVGKEFVKQLSDSGCNLFLTGTNESKLKDIARDTSSFYKACDLSKDINLLVSSIRDTIKTIDILINCAGIFITKSVKDSTDEDFIKSFDVNVRAPFLLIKEFSNDMINNKWGRIVNIGSSSSYSGFSNTSIYCSSKHALLGLSRSVHSEFINDNIRTYCFSPGSVKTEMGKQVEGQDFSTFINPEELCQYIINAISYDSDMITEEVRFNRVNVQ